MDIESVLVERRSIEESLKRADERGIKYVVVVGRHHEETNLVSLYILRGQQPEGNVFKSKCGSYWFSVH